MSKEEILSRYRDFFTVATGINQGPFPYQQRLALEPHLPQLVCMPTGLGKMAAAVLAWLWRRRFAEPAIREKTPRRLVYCLPMRVLVEQTYEQTLKWLDRLGLLAGTVHWTETENGLPTHQAKLQQSQDGEAGGYAPDPDATPRNGLASENGDTGAHPIAVHLLMGGEERTDWALWPERDAILIGTQDMLLSRALNRGYAAGRARWPMEFGLLNNDCLWVFDEVQLMSTGLATSLQLDAWRKSLRLRPAKGGFPVATSTPVFRPCESLWMSATMAKPWLERAVDWKRHVAQAWEQNLIDKNRFCSVDRQDNPRVVALFNIEKTLRTPYVAELKNPRTNDAKLKKQASDEYLRKLADKVNEHRSPDKLTLVILNTVDRATSLYEHLKDIIETDVRLIHSRFRPHERSQWRNDFLNNEQSGSRVIVSTQVIEAGVDISAAVLFTELAPWASLVQRFGRCARYPEDERGDVFWMDVHSWPEPYEQDEMDEAREIIQDDQTVNVGLAGLDAIAHRHSDDKVQQLYPYDPKFIPRDKDLVDLFDTTPDLTGADVDISRFIRDGIDLDVQAFWRDVTADGPKKKDKPFRDELCPVPFHEFRKFVERKPGRIWRWNYREGWQLVSANDEQVIYPGQVFLLEKSCGGYNRLRGWTGNPDDTEFSPVQLDEASPRSKAIADDEQEESDENNKSKWFSILVHTRHVCQRLETILDESCGDDAKRTPLDILRLAARWHDWGKGHEAFVAKLRRHARLQAKDLLNGEPAAKAPDEAWLPALRVDQSYPTASSSEMGADPSQDQSDKRRLGFRHELASTLGLLETLWRADPDHDVFKWPNGLAEQFGGRPTPAEILSADNSAIAELKDLGPREFNLLLYLVASHHGKVRMSLRSSPDDARTDVPNPCPGELRQARGVRDGDKLPGCKLPLAASDAENGFFQAPCVELCLDPMELGLSARYGPSWRERTQFLLEHWGPFRLAYLESLLRAADCRASREEAR